MKQGRIFAILGDPVQRPAIERLDQLVRQLPLPAVRLAAPDELHVVVVHPVWVGNVSRVALLVRVCQFLSLIEFSYFHAKRVIKLERLFIDSLE